MRNRLSCFKAYDIRGQVGIDVTEALARDLGRAIATVLQARSVVVGRDARASSPQLLTALAEGITSVGVDVLDLGLCGTEEVYFATAHFRADGGVMVTASHNPIADNGFKLVGPAATPLTDEVFRQIEALAASGVATEAHHTGTHRPANCREAYVARVLSFIEPNNLTPLKLVANAGNGAAGPSFDAVIKSLQTKGAQLEVERLNHAPDPRFPNGIPNPMLPENQPVTSEAVVANGADFGIAWDGDFDRCFFFDHTGEFIPGEYVVGLLAAAMLHRFPGEAIVHDARVFWNTQDVVARVGGQAIASRTGHALMKAKMRETNAVYGGEMSAHHYFRDFMFCDSGMIPWLLVAAHISETGRPLRDLVADMRAGFPSSGEINFHVDDAEAAIARVEAHYGAQTVSHDTLDGLSLEMGEWRLNLRRSNTEALLRLNVEARGADHDLGQTVDQISGIIAN